MVMYSAGSKQGFFDRLKAAFSPASQYQEVKLQEPCQLLAEGIKLRCDDYPVELSMGSEKWKLQLYPERSVEGGRLGEAPSFLIFDPDSFFSRISGFVRLAKGDHLILGREENLQRKMFDYPESIARRQLSIAHDGDALLFKGLDKDSGTKLKRVADDKEGNRIRERQMANLHELRNIYGGPIQLLSPEQALADINAVNEILEKEPLRQRNDEGKPGGVVRLPEKMIPIIIGDLHAQVDNLLTILSHNEFLEMMGDGKAAMVFLGDAVHSEIDGQLEDMESSLLIMDFIFRLKLWFPQQVFYVRGNHDCFSEELGKDGVPQGLLWARALKSVRGDAYKEAMERFYQLLPYLALSKDYVACHAAPPKSKVSMDMLVNIHKYPSLIEEVTSNRLYRPNRPAGYTRGDVKRLRNTLKLAPEAELFVGHTPLTRHDTLWHNVGGIKHHDVVFSGNLPWIGLYTRVGDEMIPLRYRSEPMTAIINAFGN